MKLIRYSFSAIFALACLTLITGCSDKEKIQALERVIEEQKKAIEQERTEVVRIKAELDLSTTQGKEKEKELAATSERMRNLDQEHTQLKAKISEKQEEELATKNKYSHEALGENPSKEQLDAFFISFETIERDSPKILEEFLNQAVKSDEIEYRDGIGFQKGKFTPYTGWVISQAKKIDIMASYAQKCLRWCKNGKWNGVMIEFTSQTEKVDLSITWDENKIRKKGWYRGGNPRVDAYYNDGELYSVRSWKIDPNDRTRTIECVETNLKDGNGYYVFYDLNSQVTEKGKNINSQMHYLERYYKGNVSSRYDFENGIKRVYTSYSLGMKTYEVVYDTSLRNNKGFKGSDEDKKSQIRATSWSYNGKLKEKVFYKDGKIVKTEKF